MAMEGEGGQETLTILFTDVEGSTAFLTRMGDITGNKVMAAHERLVIEEVARHDGRHIKSLGDGCLAVFASPRRAVECAVAVQRAAMSAPLRVRMGLNTGEVSFTGGDVFGAAVNAGARIMAKAHGGEIVISDVVRQLLGSTSGFELRDRGRVRLRGFPERWRLHEVLWREDVVSGGNPELTPFVGRAAELARLRRVLDSLTVGRGAAVVIRGEAGIGKTRLAGEALDYAQSRGWRVLVGRASPFGAGLGLEPIIEAFGGVLRGLDRPALDALVADLPHLARLFEGTGLTPPAPLGDMALERTLLFQSVARLLERLARGTPLVLLIDDIQWADPASLELLHQLARDIDRHPAALVFTYRSDEPDQTDRLRRLLVSLRRLRGLEEIELARLDAPAVEMLVREFLGTRAPSGLLDILVRAAGTPLFVGAFLRGLLERGQLRRSSSGWELSGEEIAVPTAIRDLVLERLDVLQPAARGVVDLVSLSGGAASHDVLSEAAELPPELLSGVVDQLMTAGLLAEELESDQLTYRLTHPLFYEVAADALPTMKRRRGHATLAMAVERVRPTDLEGLGRHYLAAGPVLDPTRSLEVLTNAGRRASRRGAQAEASRLLDAAVVLARQADREQLPTLLERLAQARHGAGQTDTAVASWCEALELQQPAGDAAALARVRRALGMAEFDRGRLVEAREHLDAAAGLLTGLGATAELADVHTARVTVLHRLGWRDELLAVADDIDGVAARLQSPRVRAQADYVRACALVDTGHPHDALRRGLRGLRSAEHAGDDALTYRLHTACCDASIALGDHARVLEHSEVARRLTGVLGVGVLAGGAALCRPFSAIFSGEWDEARAYSDADVEVARRSDNERLTVSVLVVRVWLLALRGDLPEAEDLLSELKQRFPPSLYADLRGFGLVRTVEARVALEQEQPDRAAAVLGELDQLSGDAVGRLMVSLAEVRARSGDLEAALQAARALSTVSSPFAVAEAAYAEGIAYLASDPRKAAEVLATSAAGFEQLAMPFHTARSRLERAAALVSIDPAEATTEAGRARTVFEQLGAKRYAARAKTVLSRLGVRVQPARALNRRSGPLSRREIEVAALVAEGLTNAEIAERLTVSVRTVTSHLDHIYTRLGIGSRAALARHVSSHGGQLLAGG
jgi:class 3 adenylate cyclase/DNA-binding NarL/FixJ family response regulator